MFGRTRGIFLSAVFFLCISIGYGHACTAVIISGKATPDGRPLLWKNRDTDALDNRLEYFRGERYCFTGLVNSNSIASQNIGEGEREVWIGSNTAGFSIMNTASYNIKDDDVPMELMDREGVLIFKALGVCRDLSDFECFLDTLSRPMGVQADFGVIDAYGGAAMYEVGNSSYVKYDVNDPEVAPEGYLVFTNFSFSGRKEDYKGYERYLTATAMFSEAYSQGVEFTPDFIFSLSRSYRNDFMGVDYNRDYDFLVKEGYINGVVPDRDFIPRYSTSASVVIQGVSPGENPLHTVMWTILGYPLCSVSIPVPVCVQDILPYYMKASDASGRSLLCDLASEIKSGYVFRFSISNGREYLDLAPVLGSGHGQPSMLSCCISADNKIRAVFYSLYTEYLEGRISHGQFIEKYKCISPSFFDIYEDGFKYFICKR